MTRARALVALHVAVLLFGFAGLFGKWLVLSPVAIVLGRTAIAAAALGILRRHRPRSNRRFNIRLVGNGAVLALHWVSFFAAVQVSSVAIGLLGYASFPLFVVILERALLGKRWTPREAATALCVTAGLVLLVPSWSWSDPTVHGLLWGMVSGFTFALLAVMNRRHAAMQPAIDIAFWQNLFAALCLVPFALAESASIGAIGARDIMLLLVLGLLSTALAHTLFIASLRSISAHSASVVASLEPVYGMVLAAAFLAEFPGPRTLAGAALIVGAAIHASRRAASSVPG